MISNTMSQESDPSQYFSVPSLLPSNPLVKHPHYSAPGCSSALDGIYWPILAGPLGVISFLTQQAQYILSWNVLDLTLVIGPVTRRGSGGSSCRQGFRGAGVVLHGEASAVSSCTR